MGTMDPYLVGRNAAVLQYTRFAYTDQATRRRISNAATPKPGRFDEEWKELGLAPMRMRGRTELPEASLILTSVKKKMKLEEFRSFRTSKRRKKRRKQRSDEEKLKLRIVLCV